MIRDRRPVSLEVTIPEPDEDRPTGPRARTLQRLQREVLPALRTELRQVEREAREVARLEARQAKRAASERVREALREAGLRAAESRSLAEEARRRHERRLERLQRSIVEPNVI